MNNENYVPNTPQPAELSVEWVMAKMDAIMRDNAHLTDAMNALRNMEPENLVGASYGGKAEAIAESVKAREATNQQTLKFLEKIYDGLKPVQPDPARVLNSIDITALAELMDGDEIVELVKTLAR